MLTTSFTHDETIIMSCWFVFKVSFSLPEKEQPTIQLLCRNFFHSRFRDYLDVPVVERTRIYTVKLHVVQAVMAAHHLLPVVRASMMAADLHLHLP